MIRALRPTDLPRLARFLRRPSAAEITAHTWPKVEPESGHLPVQQMLWHSLGQGPAHGRAWLAEIDGAIVGIVAGRARCHGLVWDVEHLHVLDAAPKHAEGLLDRLCQDAASGGARRVFMEAPAGAPGLDVARHAGFEQYTSSTVYRLAPPFSVGQHEHLDGRPRLRADEQALFQLYNAAVPAVIRSAEAMTYEEWSALHRGRKRWSPSLVGDRHQYVCELGMGLAGWLQVVYGQKSQLLELLIDPRYESMVDRFIGYGLKHVSVKASVYSTVREYQARLGSGLERRGFELVGHNDIYVRQLAARIAERELAAAKILGG